MRKKWFIKSALILSLSLINFAVYAQSGYKLPPKSIADLVNAPATNTVQLSNSGNYMVTLAKAEMLSIEQLSEPKLGLAGYLINPENNANARKDGFQDIKITNLNSNKEVSLSGLPKNLFITNLQWSPNEQHLAFQQIKKDGIELWVINIQTGTAKLLTKSLIIDIVGTPYQWFANSAAILGQFVPANRGVAKAAPIVPTSPISLENLGRKVASRTYQNLIANKHDEYLFDFYLTAQLKTVDLNGKETNIGKPAIYRSFDLSPDNKYILKREVIKPYSYTAPAASFNSRTTVVTLNDNLVKELKNGKYLAIRPTGPDATVNGPRNHAWRPDKPAMLYWVAANDKGNPELEIEIRDIVYQLNAPFNKEPEQLISSKYRVSKIWWARDNFAILSESWRTKRIIKRSVFNPTIKSAISNSDDKNSIASSGNYLLTLNKFGQEILLVDSIGPNNYTLFITGNRVTDDNIAPYFLKWNTNSKKKDTLFKSKAPQHSIPIKYNPSQNALVYSSESVNETPNYYIINLSSKKTRQLTAFQDPYPTLKGVTKEQLRYKRSDSIDLSATLYLPAGYKKEDGPLPLLMWAYPREFKTVTAASKLTESPYRYTRISPLSPIYWVTRGYAVLDKADMPILGVGKVEPNDTFIAQIIDNAKTAINYLAEKGIADPERVAVGGHSYGAFMTTNLLAHSNLFAAGIASSGAYNRSLTPYGFQGERRSYWEAMDTYNQMSPFNYAPAIKTPILLMHGQADENSGTFPIQSERLYAALQGQGATAKLVMFPNEEHTYRAKESILHRLYEIDLWLEKYVKNKGKAAK